MMNNRYYLKFTTGVVGKALAAETPNDLSDLPVEVVLIPMQTKRYGEVSVGLLRSIVVPLYEKAVESGETEVELPFDVPSDEDYERWGLKREGEHLVPAT